MAGLRSILLSSVFLLGLLQSCAPEFKGSLSTNQPPHTFLTTDTIKLAGTDRFGTQIRVRWWGDDPDGLVKAYEYTFDNPVTSATLWKTSLRNDTTFSMSIPPGNDTFNFRFTVRAVDNQGIKDPNPPSLYYPARNSPPSVSFTYLPNNGNPLAGGNPTTSFPVIRYTWDAYDDDGAENLSSFEFCLNDTTKTPLVLPAAQRSLILQAVNPTASISDCQVYPGNYQIAYQDKLSGLILNDSNTLYVRVKDLSNAYSAWTPAQKIYVRKPSSNTLLVNAYSINNSDYSSVTSFYLQQLQSAGVSNVDTLNLLESKNGQYINLQSNNRAQAMTFALFDKIIWYSDNADFSLSFGSQSFANFLNKGGKMAISTYFSGSTPITDPSYDIYPIDSVLTPPVGSTLILMDTSKVVPYQSANPTLKYSLFLPVVRPLKFSSGAVSLYKAKIIRRIGAANFTPFLGQSDVIGYKINPVNNSKIILSSLEFHKLNKDNTMGQFFQSVLKPELGL